MWDSEHQGPEGVGIYSTVCGFIQGIPEHLSRVKIYDFCSLFGEVVGLHVRVVDDDHDEWVDQARRDGWPIGPVCHYQGSGFVQYRYPSGLISAIDGTNGRNCFIADSGFGNPPAGGDPHRERRILISPSFREFDWTSFCAEIHVLTWAGIFQGSESAMGSFSIGDDDQALRVVGDGRDLSRVLGLSK